MSRERFLTNVKRLRALAAVALVAAGMAATRAETPDASVLPVSPGLRELLRAEMRELVGASKAISLALPAGDWAQLVATSEKMRKSYILEQKLSKAQKAELEALPERFKGLDGQFHARTVKLALAASQKDAELAAFHFGRLLEACAGCHAAYAQQRFPGFADPPADSHHRH